MNVGSRIQQGYPVHTLVTAWLDLVKMSFAAAILPIEEAASQPIDSSEKRSKSFSVRARALKSPLVKRAFTTWNNSIVQIIRHRAPL
jgi:hypothetical protein